MNVLGCVSFAGLDRLRTRGDCGSNESCPLFSVCRRGSNGIDHERVRRDALLFGGGDGELLYFLGDFQ